MSDSDVEVEHIEGATWTVTIGHHHYAVTVDDDDARDLASGDAERLVRESFVFLLEREPASSILLNFDLAAIERYFPEWREEMRARLG